jgi:hypothetical protein
MHVFIAMLGVENLLDSSVHLAIKSGAGIARCGCLPAEHGELVVFGHI